MSYARLNLANSALDRVFGEGIGSFEDDGREAQLINRHFDKAVEYVLRRNNAASATTTDCLLSIPADDCGLPSKFCYAYSLPCKFIKIIQVWSEAGTCQCKGCSEGTPVEYRRQSIKRKSCGKPEDAIISPCCGPLKIEYVYMADDALEALDADLCNLITIRLAFLLSMPLRADKKLKADLEAEYRREEEDFRENSVQEDATEICMDSGDLVRARIESYW